MSAEALDEDLTYLRNHFGEVLLRAGFRSNGHHCWVGPVEHSTGSTEVVIALPARFPYSPPRVEPVDGDAVPWSWHRERSGALCLVAEDDRADLWWADADVFLAHVGRWFYAAASGWVNDRPDMDLDRYFKLSEQDDHIYLYPELEPYLDKPVRFQVDSRNPKVATLVGPGAMPPKPRKDRYIYAAVADLGDVRVPPRGWLEVESLLAEGPRLAGLINSRKISVLVLRYRRDEHHAAIALEVWPTQAGSIAVRRLSSASTSQETRRLRAGTAWQQLQTFSAAIIGLGALGSFLADALARVGVTRLTLIDGDVVLPGNLVRHTAGENDIGRFKVDAVKRRLTTIFGVPADHVTAHAEVADDVSTIRELLQNHDLVINASAEWTVSKMLRDNADALGVHALTVVLQNEGKTFRVDVLPPFDNADPLPSSDRGEPVAAVYEAGCGSPVSLTPPPAVAEAAAAAARHVVAMLTGKPLSAAGETRELDLFEGGESR
jgi:hypothetical protein